MKEIEIINWISFFDVKYEMEFTKVISQKSLTCVCMFNITLRRRLFMIENCLDESFKFQWFMEVRNGKRIHRK